MVRSLCRSLLAFFSLGMLGSAGCGKADVPEAATAMDVTLNVPGMH
jgi:hypothetical protein